MHLEELQTRLQSLKGDNDAILAKAESEKRDLTIEESQQFDQNLQAFDQTVANIERLQKNSQHQEMLTKGTGRVTKPSQPATDSEESLNANPPPKKPSITPLPNPVFEKTGGFRSFGEMALSVKRACTNGGVQDPRLERLASASTYGNEASGTDGGYAVPTEFRTAIMQTVLGDDRLASLCDQVTVGGNTFTCPVDETSPWQTSGGILANWEGESQAGTQSKPSLQDRTIKLNKLKCLVPMTDELLEDAAGMDSYLRRKAPEKIAFKLDLAILQGTGAGQPLGLLNSPALVTVSKNNPQTADTLTGKNILEMYSRCYGATRGVWVVNQDVLPQLYKLSLPGTDNEGNTATGFGSLLYVPPGGLSASPYGTLMGRPVMLSQACETIGDLGDIFFADFSQYLLLLKSGVNPRVDTSMHLWFDQDMTAFKFVLRVGGMPWWSTTLAARDGSATYSPFVTLEAR